MMRFSAAVTLFGMEQLENAIGAASLSEELSSSIDRFRQSIDSFANVVAGEIDPKKRNTLKSVTSISEQTVRQTLQGVSMMGPKEILEAASELMRNTSESVADLLTDRAESVEERVKRIWSWEPRASSSAGGLKQANQV